MAKLYTIGHSNRPLDAFIGLLKEAGVGMIIDVRTIPKSRHNPQFNADVLEPALQGVGIRYKRIPELGGLRSRREDQGPSPNGYWENEAFRNYADYTATPPFKAGLDQLRSLGEAHACSIMCAEAEWRRCHRQIIADYLLTAGENGDPHYGRRRAGARPAHRSRHCRAGWRPHLSRSARASSVMSESAAAIARSPAPVFER